MISVFNEGGIPLSCPTRRGWTHHVCDRQGQTKFRLLARILCMAEYSVKLFGSYLFILCSIHLWSTG
uniref:Uncharacterized protein n=1 Tax=Arundo donax TaxID=35708 RepID=A0A0A9GJF9_ARUDO